MQYMSYHFPRYKSQGEKKFKHSTLQFRVDAAPGTFIANFGTSSHKAFCCAIYLIRL